MTTKRQSCALKAINRTYMPLNDIKLACGISRQALHAAGIKTDVARMRMEKKLIEIWMLRNWGYTRSQVKKRYCNFLYYEIFKKVRFAKPILYGIELKKGERERRLITSILWRLKGYGPKDISKELGLKLITYAKWREKDKVKFNFNHLCGRREL